MWQERIEKNPANLVGKPVIKGTRLAVEFLLDLMAERWTTQRILSDYPQLNPTTSKPPSTTTPSHLSGSGSSRSRSDTARMLANENVPPDMVTALRDYPDAFPRIGKELRYIRNRRSDRFGLVFRDSPYRSDCDYVT